MSQIIVPFEPIPVDSKILVSAPVKGTGYQLLNMLRLPRIVSEVSLSHDLTVSPVPQTTAASKD